MDWQDLARPKPCPYGSPLYQRVIKSPLWVAQEKVDGWRVIVETSRGGSVTMTTRHGERLSPPADFAASVSTSLPAMSMIDAELVRPWKRLVVFDVMKLAGADMTSKPLSERMMRLGSVLDVGGAESRPLHIVQSAATAKDAFYHEVLERGGEGIVLKRLCDNYPRGGVVWLKVKP